MKSNLVTFARNPFRVRGFRRQTAPLLAGLALMAGTTFVLHAQLLSIEKAGLIAWPEPTEEQIVVGSDSPTGPVWTPWPEPIFKRFGQMCMAVPTTASEQFFKLVPGIQFADDFSDTKLPYTNRGPWTLTWIQPGSEFLVTNGLLRLNWHGTNSGSFVAQPPGSENETNINNFYMSVDILDWVTSGTNWSVFGLIARGRFFGGAGSANGAGLGLNSGGVAGRVTPILSRGAWQTNGVAFDIGEFPPPYRLEFSGVGFNFSLRLVNLTTMQPIREMSMTYVSDPRGFMGLYVNAPPGVNESHNITVDNFFMSGTKP